MSIRVELLGGRGERLWPAPGRVFAVGPRHSFADLAESIDGAFGRWDLAHLREFTLSDGSVLAEPDDEPDDEPGAAGLDKLVSGTVSLGGEFRYIFDLGDEWVHSCRAASEPVDPIELFGAPVKRPICASCGEQPSAVTLRRS